MEKFKFLEHTADVKFQAEGKNIEEAFENAALALKETIARNIEVKVEKERKIKVEGEDLESLLYNFLEEFLFLLDAEDFLFSKIKNLRIEKKKSGYELKAEILGDSASRYNFSNDVKAITYNDMFVKEEGVGKKRKVKIQVVVDV